MFNLKITKKVETETGVVLTLTPISIDNSLSGEVFYKVALDSTYKIGDEFVVDLVVEEPIP